MNDRTLIAYAMSDKQIELAPRLGHVAGPQRDREPGETYGHGPGMLWPGMTMVLSLTAATFASAALIIPSMLPPDE